jgi:essential nuclear protein 1
MQRYKSGKLPKPLKILPTLPNWEGLLDYLEPEEWTENAVYEVTKLFASTKPTIAQAWLGLVLLPRVRNNIRETKKLNVHLWNALKKS